MHAHKCTLEPGMESNATNMPAAPSRDHFKLVLVAAEDLERIHYGNGEASNPSKVL